MYHFLKIYNLYWLFSNLSRHSTKLKIAQIFFFPFDKIQWFVQFIDKNIRQSIESSANYNFITHECVHKRNSIEKLRHLRWLSLENSKRKKFPFLVNLFVVDSNRINDENSPWPLEGVRWKRRKEKKKRKARRGEKKDAEDWEGKKREGERERGGCIEFDANR